MATLCRIMEIRIYLTGRVTLEVDGNVAVHERQFRGKQGRLLFTYLASERTRPVPREELAKIIWPGEMALSWEVALSALISRLRGLLSLDGLKNQGIALSSSFGQYHLRLPKDTWIDLEAVTSAVDNAEGALRSGGADPQGVLGPATVAVSIARRPFLSGIDGEWVESQRRKLERQLLRALDCLSTMWLRIGEPSLAVETATQTVALDPFRERSYQLLMHAYDASGNKAEAVRLYHRLAEILAAELGTGPSAKTEAIYSGLLR